MISTVAYSIGPLALLGYLAHKFYFAGGVCKSKKRLDGKIVIVTGANCGIGYETALDLAKRGAHVILACRDLKRAQAAADKIILISNNNKVEVELLDLSSFHSIHEFAERIKNRFKRLDILINNAGMWEKKRQLSKDGIELTFAVNHLGPFLLTNLLLDLLKSSAPSRIINVSSTGHFSAKMKWDDLEMKKDYGGFAAYKQSKLANVLFTKYLAKKLEGTGVTTVSLHPGGVRTEIARSLMSNKFSLIYAVYIIFYPLLIMATKNCREGAQTTLHCALDDSIPKYNGLYFHDCKSVKMSPEGEKLENAERLWEISSKMVGLE